MAAAVERDDFSNPATGLFTLPAPTPNGRAAYENGGLVIEFGRRASTDPPAFPVYANRPASFANGVVDVEGRLLSPNENGTLYVSVRRNPANGDGYYFILIPRRKTVQVLKGRGAERPEIARVQVEGILSEASNRLTVVADGPELQLYVNGQVATQARDESFASGQVGLGASPGLTVPSDVRAAFDDFRVVALR